MKFLQGGAGNSKTLIGSSMAKPVLNKDSHGRFKWFHSVSERIMLRE